MQTPPNRWTTGICTLPNSVSLSDVRGGMVRVQGGTWRASRFEPRGEELRSRIRPGRCRWNRRSGPARPTVRDRRWRWPRRALDGLRKAHQSASSAFSGGYEPPPRPYRNPLTWSMRARRSESSHVGVMARTKKLEAAEAGPERSRRRSAREWAEEVAAWKRSGFTAKDYASRRRNSAATLLWWSSRGRVPLAEPRHGDWGRRTAACRYPGGRRTRYVPARPGG